MTTPARYPTQAEIDERLKSRANEQNYKQGEYFTEAVIRHAIDIERERVAREAGEVSCWRYVLGNGHPFAWDCGSPPADAVVTADIHGWTIELAYTRPPSLPAGEPQNSASNPLSPGEYFRCDECHEPAGTRQVCRSCVRLEIERDDAVESQNSAVKVPDDVMESAKFLAQWFPGGRLYRDHASAILSYLQSLTQTTEKS